LGGDPLGAYAGDLPGVLDHRLKRRGLDFKTEHRGEADGAQHPQLVFGEAAMGIADGTHDFPLDVLAAADKIEHTIGQRIIEDAVDRKVATKGVFARGAEGDAVRMATVAVALISAKRGD